MFDDFVKNGVIEPEELRLILSNAAVKVLDASFELPDSGVDPNVNFIKSRISGAKYFDISEVCDQSSPLPHMLPSAKEFEKAACGLGINNDDLIVVYGQGAMSMGPARVWWLFKYFGHDRVTVLNGGLRAWKSAGGEIQSNEKIEQVFSSYKVLNINYDLVSNIDQIEKISHSSLCPILDARPNPRFMGKQAEPRAGLRSGHIPNSQNIPANCLLDKETGKLKSETELRSLFANIDLNSHSTIYLTCGSGVTACMIALTLYHLGCRNFSVYDGSWAEWGCKTSGKAVVSC